MNQPTGPARPSSLVSVIVRSMDRATLEDALASVAAQTHAAIEVIVVDAKGPQHRIIAPACGRFALRQLRSAEPLGRAAAANLGLRAAQGEFTCFLDDDDWFAPDHIALLVQRLQADSAAVAAYSATTCVEADAADGTLREVMRYDEPFDAARLLCENYLPIHSVLFRSAAAAALPGFDESLPIFEDWDFWIQLSRAGTFSHLPQFTATYRLGSGDSGLYGNAALQEEYALRVAHKHLGGLPADALAIWALCRRGLRIQDALRREIDSLHQDLRNENERLKREAAEAAAQLRRIERERADVQARLEQALRGATREYEQAMALLRQEQFTVLRPIARHLKRALRAVWRQLPSPVQKSVRRVIGRPVAAHQHANNVVLASGADAQKWKEALAGGTAGAFTVIVFPVIDWHFRIQRPQHLARELAAQGHRVLYLSTTFARGAAPAACRLIESPVPNVHVLQLPLSGAAPNIYEDVLSDEQAIELADTLAWLQQACDLGPLVSLVNLPFWRCVATRLPANLVVYDCMDYHAGFSTNTGRMLDEEAALLRDCDLLVTTSARLADIMQQKAPGKRHALVRNAAEVAHFAAAPDKLALQRDERPVIGYFGAISEWFDMPLVTAAARAHPEWRFVLVGSTFGCDVTQAKRLPNVEFIGEVPYADLPGWVHSFDVCTIPFIINELTSCTNPVKVYEYLSAGKPVVATRMPELEAIADQVYLADGAAQFAAQLEHALDDARRGGRAAARSAWASEHTWQARAAMLSAAVASCTPKVSVVVLCYNNLALTKACLDSVERHSHWPDLELVVVDNASSDGTPEALRQFAATRPWVKLVLNDKNLGFAAGNNVGLAAATGEILVMLNNDTQVSPGWVHGLWRHLDRDPGLGLVGPVTNNIGNEAKIEPGYADTADMPRWAAARAVRHANQQFNSRVLAFFCVALRRKVYEQIGGLDESFGLGFFEDDDYCNRVRAAAWRLAIAEDVFVHHHLSASFDQLKASSRQALFEKNRAIYESKWGPWVPHEYRQVPQDQ
jgi:GT2 family glycosyltransferase/glycosyltransferase involved in cell wall biosynthesis